MTKNDRTETDSQRLCRIESLLHFRRNHPDYEYRTTSGPRKAWCDEDKPPPGVGWERNWHAGDNGWSRFNTHEESYWMRALAPQEIRVRHDEE